MANDDQQEVSSTTGEQSANRQGPAISVRKGGGAIRGIGEKFGLIQLRHRLNVCAAFAFARSVRVRPSVISFL